MGGSSNLDGPEATVSVSPPHTPDARPDLQGVWSVAHDVPLERPRAVAEQEALTAGEAAACHEGNRGMVGPVCDARAAEREAERDVRK